MGVVIERIDATTHADVIRGLADLLLDAIDDNAGVSFMAGLQRDDAAAWWREKLTSASARSVFLIARDEQDLVGTVQLQPAWAPNQPYRADVAKLIVLRRARHRGIARKLIEELERCAREQGFSLLVLDTCKGDAAEQLYTSLGWIRVGEIPRYSFKPDRSWCDTVFFYKRL